MIWKLYDKEAVIGSFCFLDQGSDGRGAQSPQGRFAKDGTEVL